MYTQVSKEILLEINEKYVRPTQEFVDYYREWYADCCSVLSKVNNFEQDLHD